MSIMKSYSKPSNWPQNLRYIKAYHYHPSVSSEILNHLRAGPSHATTLPQPPKVAIRVISNPIHPAQGQCGLFAAQKIQPNTHIIDYIGEVHCDDRSDSDYDLSLCRLPGNISVGIDSCTMGNESRFINDYRGVSSKPNAMFAEGRNTSGLLTMCVWSGHEGIKKGEEILVSYGKSWWRARSR